MKIYFSHLDYISFFVMLVILQLLYDNVLVIHLKKRNLFKNFTWHKYHIKKHLYGTKESLADQILYPLESNYKM